MIRRAGRLGDSARLGRGNNPRVDDILIGGERRVFLIPGGNFLPPGLGALATAVDDVRGNDLAGRSIHGNPCPLPVLLLPHIAPQLVQLCLRPLQDHRRGACRRLDVEIVGGRLESFDHELQEPPEPNTYCTPAPARREALQEQSFNQRALLFRDKSMFWAVDNGPAIYFAAVILLTGMQVPLFREPVRATLGTGLSCDHRACSGLFSLPFNWRQA